MARRWIAALLLCCIVTAGVSTTANAAYHVHRFVNGVCIVCGKHK